MFKNIFAKKPTSKTDVAFAIFATATAAWKAYETIVSYKEAQKEIQS